MSLPKTVLNKLSVIESLSKYSSLSEVLSNTDKFETKIRRPTTRNWLGSVAKEIPEAKLLSYANASYPVIHESVLTLIQDFLDFKRENGSTIEKSIYSQLDIIGLVDRLILKRPLSFVGACDGYTLRDGSCGAGDWERVGTEKERKGHSMVDYMTYDEIKLSAFLQISSLVAPINGGSRDNVGRKEPNHIEEAVYVAGVGARFERPGRMETQEIVVDKTQNTAENGYGAKTTSSQKSLLDVFAKFYGLNHFPLFEEKIPENFNSQVYVKRIQTSIETFLIEANERGKQFNQKVYVHVTGLGLGVWMVRRQIQNELYLKAFQNVLQAVSLPHIAIVDFSWISSNGANDQLKNDQTFPGTDIVIKFTRKNPFDQDKDKNGKLVVALYAWDGNSFPGNEYWEGHLSASGDPAAACCTQIPELQNGYINSANICGSNLHVATTDAGLMHVAKFARERLNKI